MCKYKELNISLDVKKTIIEPPSVKPSCIRTVMYTTIHSSRIYYLLTAADPGFLRGGANLKGGTKILFAENLR